ncbi:MAG TPA: hypothetical protein VFD77_01390 [Brumimicrobium sp.]|nr:hypothetical protein [Brumimicrobium sp.]
MKGGLKKVYFSVLALLSVFLYTSCEDPELDALMADYCDCISESRYNDTKHMECIEKMDSIKMKYEGKPRKINEVLKKTNECY